MELGKELERICARWRREEVGQLENALSSADAIGRRQALPNPIHIPLEKLLRPLTPIMDKYELSQRDRSEITDALISAAQLGRKAMMEATLDKHGFEHVDY